MNERDYILAGNYQMLDALYQQLEAQKRIISLQEVQLSSYREALMEEK